MKTSIIDLSHHNDIYSYEDLKRDGIIGIIHKATEGTSFIDKMYHERKKRALEHDLAWASYHYLHHGRIDDQIKHYINTIQPIYGERVVLDVEEADTTREDVEQAVENLIDRGNFLQITIYSGHIIKQLYPAGVASVALTGRTSLWIAQYTNASQPTWPTHIWPTWSLWQWTDKGTVKGVKSPTDMDRFNGDDDQCMDWMGPATGTMPAPKPEPVRPVVGLQVTGDVEVTINGKRVYP